MLAYHEEVSLWMRLVSLRCKDLRPFKVFRKWCPQMRIVEYTEVLTFGSI